ncbi:UPF0175 family protein [Aequorivita sp. H23M31]|uniref:UPF0175 family protein n=1 Tax=Aequorivita ciconiae TaxID=2494375 RepID=A0A410G4H6_9FLAO|nr:UPF0175 family protein [Aequorivita sp. H23M31]QAA82178.1 UPF0175 family protein [Aequorivita sp. H23M31]
MKSLSLNIPSGLDLDPNELAIFIASRLYEKGRLSSGQAAEMAGLTKGPFAELLGRYNVSMNRMA